jgi:hypothetical protein
MPEFAIVSEKEAKIRTMPGRQGKFINEYADYIQQLPQGQAGKLRPAENENPATLRRRLVAAGRALDTQLVIKRSGTDVYFWKEGQTEEQPKRRYTRQIRRGSPGSLLPPDMLISEPEPGEQGVPAEESPELGQTEPVVSDAMRRVDPE